tara:strand:+ start:1384 stop:1830 length:447 start_codon:yes stop_codon:yes gene_type:complete
MIYLIILSIIIITIFLSKFIEIVHLPHEKFRKYIKFLTLLLIISSIFFLFRFFPAILGAIPGVFLVLYRWQFLITILSKLLLRKKYSSQSKKTMTRNQALEILGLKDGASREQIINNYNKLIKKNHPDLGGSEWITKQLNQARDILLG